MFVSQPIADWWMETAQAVREGGGDPRAYADVLAVVSERQAEVATPTCSAEDVADHLDHIRDVAGIAHVGLGSDFDGAPSFPTDLTDVACYPRLFDVLRARRWSTQDLEALAHGNVLRAFRDVADAADD